MATTQTAILLSKEEVELIKKCRAIYQERLGSSFKFQKLPSHSTSVFAQFTIEVENREIFIKKMGELGVPTAVQYPTPLHLQPVYEYLALTVGAFLHSEEAPKRVVSHPMHPYLNENSISAITEAVMRSI